MKKINFFRDSINYDDIMSYGDNSYEDNYDEIDNIIKSVKIGEEDFTGDLIEIPKSTEEEISKVIFTISMQVDDPNASISGNGWGYDIGLYNEKPNY